MCADPTACAATAEPPQAVSPTAPTVIPTVTPAVTPVVTTVDTPAAATKLATAFTFAGANEGWWEAVHPKELYRQASNRWKAGAKEDAVIWLYIAQLRFRFYLAANPNQKADDVELLGTLQQVVGQPINLYAGGHIPEWTAAMQTALDWDEAHPDRFQSRLGHEAEWQHVRAGLIELRQYVLTHADEIRAERRANGFEAQ